MSYKLPVLWGLKEILLCHQSCDEDLMEQCQCEE